MSERVKVAVYGSLRRGQWNHCNLAGSVLVGEGRLSTDEDGRPRLHLWQLQAGYPALIPADPAREMQPALVEVYEVDAPTLARLDRLEGVPHLYRRQTAEVNLTTGGVLVAQLYVWAGRRDLNGWGGWASARPIPGGDWVAAHGKRTP